MTPQQIIDIFQANANEEYAVKMSAYLKNKFQLYGIKTPLRKSLQKDFIKSMHSKSLDQTLEIVDFFYNQSHRELHYLAIEILQKKKNKLNAKHLDFAETLILRNTWWDTVDSISAHIFGAILKSMEINDRRDYILRLSVHENMWMNRTGIIHQLFYKNQTNTELLELSIVPHINSKEFFHKKAIGWALRQYSKLNPSYVISFLEKYHLEPLSIREASKYL